MLAYVCDICGKVLSAETHKINREENPYFGLINVDFPCTEKQYHICKSCFDNMIKGTIIEYDINKKEVLNND